MYPIDLSVQCTLAPQPLLNPVAFIVISAVIFFRSPPLAIMCPALRQVVAHLRSPGSASH